MAKKCWIFVVFAAALGGETAVLSAAHKHVATAVFSRTSNGYKREKLPDGSFKPEWYVLTDGGALAEAPRDNAQEKLPFMTIARIIEKLLAEQKFLMAEEIDAATMLLQVYWGKTIPYDDINYSNQIGALGASRNTIIEHRLNAPEGEAEPHTIFKDREEMRLQDAFENELLMLNAENLRRDRGSDRNARLLGFLQDMDGANDIRRATQKHNPFEELRIEIEQARYFLIIAAYDLAEVKRGKARVLWITRVSIRSAGNSFDERLAEMVKSATRFAGRDSGRLIRRNEGKVELGELQVIGIEEDPAPPPAANRDENK